MTRLYFEMSSSGTPGTTRTKWWARLQIRRLSYDGLGLRVQDRDKSTNGVKRDHFVRQFPWFASGDLGYRSR